MTVQTILMLLNGEVLEYKQIQNEETNYYTLSSRAFIHIPFVKLKLVHSFHSK